MRRYLPIILQSLFCLFVLLYLGSLPAYAKNLPFSTSEKIIMNPTCPHYSFEVNGVNTVGTCASDGAGNYIHKRQVRIPICTYEVCADGKCVTTQDIGVAGAGGDYARCVLLYSKANNTNQYCSLIINSQLRATCNQETSFSWNAYWLSYYGRLILPALLIGLYLLGINASRSQIAAGATIALSITLLAILSNDAYRIDLILYSRSIFQFMVVMLPLVSAILFVMPKTRNMLLPLLLVFNVIDILLLLLFILLPTT